MKRKWFFIIGIPLALIGIIFLNPGSMITKGLAYALGEYREPGYETDKQIMVFLTSRNVYYSDVYRIANEKSLENLDSLGLYHVPLIQIYDKNKRMLVSANGEQCQWTLGKFFIKGDSANFTVKDTGMYNLLIDKLDPIYQNPNQDSCQYYLVAGWAKFIPKKTEALFVTIKELHESNKDVCVIHVNMDYREDWDK